jgi:hypothetical protein
MMQEDNHVLQIKYTENDYTTPQKKKKNATKAILLIKIHQDISSKKMEEIPTKKGQSIKRTMLKLYN